MKFNFEKKYFHIGLTAFLTFAACLLLYISVKGSDGITPVMEKIGNVLSPIILGFVFAYIMNPLLKIFEKKVFGKLSLKLFKDDEKRASKFARLLGVVCTLITTLAIITAILWLVIPRLYQSVVTIAANLTTYNASAEDFIHNIFKDSPDTQAVILNIYNNIAEKFSEWINTDLLHSLGDMVDVLFNGLYDVAIGFINIIIGIIISVYVLFEKEHFSAQCKKILYSVFNTKHASTALHAVKKINRAFTDFYTGKVIDSLIFGVICYIVLLIFGIPYKEFVSVIIAITNIIPFFGPFIGAIPSGILILMVDPIKCLEFIIIIIILQQFDGNILAPKILGDKTGLPGFWVLCILLIFSGFFGFIGMLVAIPLFSVIYMFIKDWVRRRLIKKKLPATTTEFMTISYIDPDTNIPVIKHEFKDQNTDNNDADKAKEEGN